MHLRVHVSPPSTSGRYRGSAVIDASGHNHIAQRLTAIGSEVAALNMNALVAGLTPRGAALASEWRRLAQQGFELKSPQRAARLCGRLTLMVHVR